jgi:hypothetical protein
MKTKRQSLIPKPLIKVIPHSSNSSFWTCLRVITLILAFTCRGESQTFSCSCSGSGVLNIDASVTGPYYDAGLGGTLYSVIEANLNYDQDNDGDIDLSEHNGCIAIAGRLIVDQNLTINNCSNIKMQPCSEIVVNAHRTLALTQNTISGCFQMWRGINVQPFGRLTFMHNEIQDAEHAILANASGVAWPPPGGNSATTIEVIRNNFLQNHIGVYALGFGSFVSNVAHMPFTRNTFIGNGADQLLPRCDQNLANWNANNGYAGVVSRSVSFTIGTPTDVGFTNTFSGLRNGIIGENCWLEVNNASVSDIAGNWSLEANMPTFNFSEGMGILANTGFSTVRNSIFNISDHGIYSSASFLTATGNNMPNVRRGIEVVSPIGFNLSENQDIYYRNRGIIGRDLQTGPISTFLSYSLNKNVIHNLDQATVGTVIDMAVEMRNGNLPDLVNARMSDNDIFLDATDYGIYITGVGHWTLDGNYVQHRALPTTQTSAGLSILVLDSPRNYLYNNTVEDIAITSGSRGYTLSASSENEFCCNWSDGNSIGYQFFNACGSTSLRRSDLFSHATAVQINATSSIGEQGPFNTSTLNYPNYDNVFNNTSGTARHFGMTVGQINSSRFHVLTDQTDDWPESLDFPNIPAPPPDLWFVDDGVGQVACTNCYVPPAVPDGRGKQIDAADLIIAGQGFDYNAPGLQALQWESSRDLYRRMRIYPELNGKSGQLDAFYTNGSSAKIGSYYIADSLVADLSKILPSMGAEMEEAIQHIKQTEEEIATALVGLSNAQTWDDSLVIYRQADAIRMGAATYSEALNLAIQNSHNQRIAKSQTAIPVIAGLQTSNLLEQNRKDALLIYAQSIGQGSYLLNPSQAAKISAIAHQCPNVGGSAVYIARTIYQLIEEKSFNDETICEAEERKSLVGQGQMLDVVFGFDLFPNPASEHVALAFQNLNNQKVNISLYNPSGQVVLVHEAYPNQYLLQVPLQGLPIGLYFCKVSTDNGTVTTRKLIIHR